MVDGQTMEEVMHDGWLNIPSQAIRDPRNYRPKVRKLYNYENDSDTYIGNFGPRSESSEW